MALVRARGGSERRCSSPPQPATTASTTINRRVRTCASVLASPLAPSRCDALGGQKAPMTPHRDACGSRDRPVPDSGGNVLGPKGFVERKAGDDIECGHEAGAEVLFVDGG